MNADGPEIKKQCNPTYYVSQGESGTSLIFDKTRVCLIQFRCRTYFDQCCIYCSSRKGCVLNIPCIIPNSYGSLEETEILLIGSTIRGTAYCFSPWIWRMSCRISTCQLLFPFIDPELFYGHLRGGSWRQHFDSNNLIIMAAAPHDCDVQLSDVAAVRAWGTLAFPEFIQNSTTAVYHGDEDIGDEVAEVMTQTRLTGIYIRDDQDTIRTLPLLPFLFTIPVLSVHLVFIMRIIDLLVYFLFRPYTTSSSQLPLPSRCHLTDIISYQQMII